MRKPWLYCAASLAAVAPAQAATVVERRLEIRLGADTVIEHTRLVVRIDSEADAEAYGSYPIRLGENRKLVSLKASVRRPDGTEAQVRESDIHEVAPPGILHSSLRFKSVRFPSLPVGSLLTLEYQIDERPYFRSSSEPLLGPEPIERLEIDVASEVPGWRWRLDGAVAGVTSEERPGGVRLTGSGLAASRPSDDRLLRDVEGARLRYAWGPGASWSDAGAWFDDLLNTLPSEAPAVRQQAVLVSPGEDPPAERLEALTRFVREAIRYVAVEVGIGGYRPSRPEAVLERRWGDCKDKALLLRELLAARGIESFLALVLASADDRIDREFPGLDGFNHVIVAVPWAEGSADWPVADGLLFIDATLTEPGLGWLPPVLQGQDALVVNGHHSRLVRLPIVPQGEGRRFLANLELDAAGSARGEVTLTLRGEAAAAFQARTARSTRLEAEASVRSLLEPYLPSAELQTTRWREVPGDAPAVALSSHVQVHGFGGSGTGGATLSSPATTPAPALLDGRAEALALTPRADRATWRLALPAGACLPEPQSQGTENAVGLFRQSVGRDGATIVIERQAELRRRWIEPAELPLLRELSLAEQRALRRRLRLACS